MVKRSVLSKLISKFNAMPTKLPEYKGPIVEKIIEEEPTKLKDLNYHTSIPIYYKATIISIMWYWTKISS